nr:transglycosylase [Bacillus subtilis]
MVTEHQTCMCDECGTMLLVKGCSKVRKHDNGIKQSIISSVHAARLSTHPSIRTRTSDECKDRIRKMFTLRRNMKKESAVDLYSKKIEARQTEIQTAMSQLKKEMEPPHPKIPEG